VQNRLKSRGWTALYHNVRLLGVQIDLLMRDPRGLLVLVEVKTQSPSRMASLGPTQARRLQRTCGFLAQWEPVEMRLALVSGEKLELLQVDALTAP
jgi:Holliday junction resolvase-like predicted endonuclease